MVRRSWIAETMLGARTAQSRIFDRHVLALHVSGFTKALPEWCQVLSNKSRFTLSSIPTTGMAGCCARAASGHAAAVN